MTFWTASELADEWGLPVILSLVKAGHLTPLNAATRAPEAGPFFVRAAVALQFGGRAPGLDGFIFDLEEVQACAADCGLRRSLLARHKERVTGLTGPQVLAASYEKPTPLSLARQLVAQGIMRQRALGEAIAEEFPELSGLALGRAICAATHNIPPEQVTDNQACDAGRRARGKKK